MALLVPLLSRGLRSRPPAERRVNIDGRVVELGEDVHNLTLGMLINLLQHTDTVRTVLKREAPQDASWLIDALPSLLTGVTRLRNPAAHDSVVRQEAAS